MTDFNAPEFTHAPVVVTKPCPVDGKPLLVARFRIWMEADGYCRAITAMKADPHLILTITDTRQPSPSVYLYRLGDICRSAEGELLTDPEDVRI